MKLCRLVEQPFKIPHIAATCLYANDLNADVVKEILVRVSSRSQEAVDTGSWREFKLLLRFLACLQGVFEGDGVFPLLDELFSRAADQQTASQEDVSRTEERGGDANINRRLALNWSKSSS
jgi:nuclear cap-binding protein subunit 1